jgi:hypothetical protein
VVVEDCGWKGWILLEPVACQLLSPNNDSITITTQALLGEESGAEQACVVDNSLE